MARRPTTNDDDDFLRDAVTDMNAEDGSRRAAARRARAAINSRKFGTKGASVNMPSSLPPELEDKYQEAELRARERDRAAVEAEKKKEAVQKLKEKNPDHDPSRAPKPKRRPR